MALLNLNVDIRSRSSLSAKASREPPRRFTRALVSLGLANLTEA